MLHFLTEAWFERLKCPGPSTSRRRGHCANYPLEHSLVLFLTLMFLAFPYFYVVFQQSLAIMLEEAFPVIWEAFWSKISFSTKVDFVSKYLSSKVYYCMLCRPRCLTPWQICGYTSDYNISYSYQ